MHVACVHTTGKLYGPSAAHADDNQHMPIWRRRSRRLGGTCGGDGLASPTATPAGKGQGQRATIRVPTTPMRRAARARAQEGRSLAGALPQRPHPRDGRRGGSGLGSTLWRMRSALLRPRAAGSGTRQAPVTRPPRVALAYAAPPALVSCRQAVGRAPVSLPAGVDEYCIETGRAHELMSCARLLRAGRARQARRHSCGGAVQSWGAARRRVGLHG